MDNTAAWQSVEFGCISKQRIHQRAVGMTGGRMHHHTRRFIYDEDMLVLIQNVEWHLLGLPIDSGFVIHLESKQSACESLLPRLNLLSVQR